MKELLLKIQKDLKEWYSREPEDIALVCVHKGEIGRINMLIEEKIGLFSKKQDDVKNE